MALESASYISQLNTANPPAGDPVANAADHLRLIKSVLQTTFPNLTGAVTSNQFELTSSLVPAGGIIMWSGAISAIPSGWGLCNGSTYTRINGIGTITAPNLQDQFIIGAGDIFPVGGRGGSSTVSGSVSIGWTALTVAQLPNFSISISDPGHNHGVNDPGHVHGNGVSNWGMHATAGTSLFVAYNGGSNTESSGTGIWLNGSGTGISAWPDGPANQGHTHTGTFSALNLPPYFALAFIMKL